MLRLRRNVRGQEFGGVNRDADKTAAVRATAASFCAAGDASCLLHIGGGRSRLGTPAVTRHVAEILASTR
jgi:L-lactate dehydrogenase complex protein LldE